MRIMPEPLARWEVGGGETIWWSGALIKKLTDSHLNKHEGLGGPVSSRRHGRPLLLKQNKTVENQSDIVYVGENIQIKE